MATKRVKPKALPVYPVLTRSHPDSVLCTAPEYVELLTRATGNLIVSDQVIPGSKDKFILGQRSLESNNDAVELYYSTADWHHSIAIVQFYRSTGYKLLLHACGAVSKTSHHCSVEEVAHVLNAFFVTPLFPGTYLSRIGDFLCYNIRNGMIPTKVYHSVRASTFVLHKSTTNLVDNRLLPNLRGTAVPERRRWNTRYVATIQETERYTPSQLSVRTTTKRAPSLEALFDPDAEIRSNT